MYCNHCGNQISDQAKYCMKCGTMVKHPEQKKWIFYGTMAVVFLISAIITYLALAL